VNWNALVEAALAARRDDTMEKVNNFLERIRDHPDSFWGENWSGNAGVYDKKRLQKHLKTFIPMQFNKLGLAASGPNVPATVTLLPVLVGTQLTKFRDAANKIFATAVTSGEGLMNWPHEGQHAPYLKKMIFKVHYTCLLVFLPLACL
jgi:hypothetical protein